MEADLIRQTYLVSATTWIFLWARRGVHLVLPQSASFVQCPSTARQPLHMALASRPGVGKVSFPVGVVCKKCFLSLADEQKSGQIMDQSLV